MSKEYKGKTGIRYYIAETPIASGGEGCVSKIENCPNYVAKIFKEGRRTFDREQKILAMIQHKLNDEQASQLTWPADVLYDNKGFAGYVMPLLENAKSLNVLMSKSYDEINYTQRVVVAYNICAVVDTIHEMNQVCGDLNPQNICVNIDKDSNNKFSVTFVDTDSYHINASNMIYRCEVGLANYIAPEIQKKMVNGVNLKTAPLPTYTKETDLFALAVHIFTLLMNGTHPFACAKDNGSGYENNMEQMNGISYDSVVLPQPVDNIKNGFFPFVEKREGIAIPVYSPKFNALPQNIRALFIKTFVDGYSEPAKRATAKEWMAAIKYSKFANCTNGHFYFSESSGCPFCEMVERQKIFFAQVNKRNIPTQSSEYSNKNVSVEASVQPVNNISSGTSQYNYSGLSNIAKHYINKDKETKTGVICLVLFILIIVGVFSGLIINENVSREKENLSSYEQKNAIDEARHNADLYYGYIQTAEEYCQNGDFVTAENQCYPAIELFPECVDAYICLAYARYMQRNLQGALDAVNQGEINCYDFCACECCIRDEYEYDNLLDMRNIIEDELN